MNAHHLGDWGPQCRSLSPGPRRIQLQNQPWNVEQWRCSEVFPKVQVDLLRKVMAHRNILLPCFHLLFLLSRLSLLCLLPPYLLNQNSCWPYLCSCGHLLPVIWLISSFPPRAPCIISLLISASPLAASPKQHELQLASWLLVGSVFLAPSTYYLCQVSFRFLFPPFPFFLLP